MELTRAQRFLAFVVVVGLLAGIGSYIFLPSALGQAGGGSAGGGRPSNQASSRAPRPGGTPAPAITSAASQPGGSSGQGQSPPDIYQWLPFSQAGLAAASRVAVKFSDDYGTYSYSQDATAYLAPMTPLITSQLAQLIGRAYQAPGVASARTSQRQVSTGKAVIVSLRAFGPASLIFVVQLTQRITSTAGASQQLTSYAVTLTGGGTSWQVSDIELASAGNS